MAARESRAAAERKKLGRPRFQHSHIIIVVEGAGDWVTKAYRPLFEGLRLAGRQVSVFYADDTRWKLSPDWTRQLASWETYLDKAEPEDYAVYQKLNPDVVFIVTPDFTHSVIARWWLSKRAPLVFVEKPFDSQSSNVEALFGALARHPVSAILGLDHYQFRALLLHQYMPGIAEHLGGGLSAAAFYMCEAKPLETNRARTLQYGLTLDMLPHLPALLAYFGDVGSIDDIQIADAGRHQNVPNDFENETYSKVRFTFEDHSDDHRRVPCTAVVGKGFKSEVKYLEITGLTGNAVRVDFTRKPDPDPAPNYPWNSLFFLDGGGSAPGPETRVIDDPYKAGRVLRICAFPGNPGVYSETLEESENQYRKLMEDLANGTDTVFGSTLLPGEAADVVRALDRVWWALQGFKSSRGWTEQVLGRLDPIQLGD
jgi:predicted dehydrogenase